MALKRLMQCNMISTKRKTANCDGLSEIGSGANQTAASAVRFFVPR